MPKVLTAAQIAQFHRDLDPAFVALHADLARRNAQILYRGTAVKDFNQTAR